MVLILRRGRAAPSTVTHFDAPFVTTPRAAIGGRIESGRRHCAAGPQTYIG